MKKIILVGILIFLFVASYKLGDTVLWHDEAEVGTIARNVLQTGLPTTISNGQFLPIANYEGFHTQTSPYLFRWQTWIMFYLAAAGLSVNQNSEIMLRLPFLLVGFVTLIPFYYLSLEIIGSKKVAWLSTFLLAFSTQYIILIRYARYYSLVMLFGVISTHFFLKYIKSKENYLLTDLNPNKKYLAIFMVAMICLFYTHYLSFYSLLLGFVSFYLVIYGFSLLKLKMIIISKNLFWFILCIILLILSTTPWMIIFTKDNDILSRFSLFDLSSNIFILLKKINRTIPLSLLLPSFIFAIKSIKNRKFNLDFLLLFWLFISTIASVSLLTALSIPPSFGPELRYILVVYPFLFIFIAFFLGKIFLLSKFCSIWVVCLFVFTNIFSLPVELVVRENYWPFPSDKSQFRSYIFEYIFSELRTGYIGPAGEINRFFNDRNVLNGNFFVSLEGASLLFDHPEYTVDNIYTYAKKHNRKMISNDLKSYDWVILRNNCSADCLFSDSESVKEILNKYFIKHEIPIYDYIVNNREEIPYHLFANPRFRPFVVIYENQKN